MCNKRKYIKKVKDIKDIACPNCGNTNTRVMEFGDLILIKCRYCNSWSSN